jgi:hypothetical protein
MIFLIQYDRSAGKLVDLRSFEDVERAKAAEERLALELELNRKTISHEIVLLEAADEAALRKTHRRYFERLEELAKTA